MTEIHAYKFASNYIAALKTLLQINDPAIILDTIHLHKITAQNKNINDEHHNLFVEKLDDTVQEQPHKEHVDEQPQIPEELDLSIDADITEALDNIEFDSTFIDSMLDSFQL